MRLLFFSGFFLREAAVAIAMKIVSFYPLQKMLLSLDLNICLTYQ